MRLKRNRVLFFLRQPRWRGKVLHSLAEAARPLAHLVHLNRLTVDLEAGLGDPALLGSIAAYMNAAEYALSTSARPRVWVRLVPRFDRECLHARGELDMHTTLYRVIRPVLRLLVTFPYVTTVWVYFRSRRYLRELDAEEQLRNAA